MIGCASTLQTITNPDMNSDVLNEAGEDSKLRGFKGDRRMVRTHRQGAEEVYEVCRESWADAIGARSGDSKITITGQGDFADKLTEELTKTYDRGDVADTTRTLLSWMCDIKMNRWENDPFVAREFSAIRQAAFEALRMPKEPPKPAQPAPKPTSTASPTPEKSK
jgi:hypothetical protein